MCNSKSILHFLPKLQRTHFHFKKILKNLILEKMHFWHKNQNSQISFAIKSIGVSQVLTKILQIDPKLNFDVFHIWKHGRISKIEKTFDDTDPPKRLFAFLWEGSGGLQAKDLGYVSGRYTRETWWCFPLLKFFLDARHMFTKKQWIYFLIFFLAKSEPPYDQASIVKRKTMQIHFKIGNYN